MGSATEVKISQGGSGAAPDAPGAAQAAFMAGIRKVAGVQRVEWHGSAVRVLVSDVRGESAAQVYDLEGEVLTAHPGSRVDVQVTSQDWG